MAGKNPKIKTLSDNQTIRIVDEVCWLCGRSFNKENYKESRTYHHSIPKRLKPKFNIEIPICKGCHSSINKEDTPYKRYYNNLRGFFLLNEKEIDRKSKVI
jgi:5-methylcytosine-specific restriction endonuclease McrA